MTERHLHDPAGYGERRRCKARSKRTGQQCGRFCAPGWDVCYYHGQNSKRGAASATFKTGKYSKALPTNMAEDFQRIANDPDLLSLREEVALVDLRLVSLVEGLNSKNLPATWERLKDMATKIRLGLDVKPLTSKDTEQKLERLIMQLNGLLMVIDQGAAESDAWKDLFDAVKMRTQVVEAERRRVVDAHRVLTIEEVRSMMIYLADLVRTHVSNDNERRAIYAGIDVLIGRANDSVAIAAGVDDDAVIDGEYEVHS
jgi:hypothetical protein